MSAPWMKFYPSDWRADPALRSCSIAARGLWVEMICIMHEAEPYGTLLINGSRVDKRRLAALAGVSERECSALLLELEGLGVFSRDDGGAIFSRRMRRDAEKAENDRKNGKKGGNPKVKGGVNPPVQGEVKAQIPEASIDRIGSARASVFTEGSKALASAFWKALGFESPQTIPPEFAGVDWRAVEWESAGWTVDLIEVEARKTGPDKPLSYHEKVFATAFAKRQAPLPVAQIRDPETVTVKHGTSKSGSLIAAIDRQIAALEAEDGTHPSLPKGSVLLLSR